MPPRSCLEHCVVSALVFAEWVRAFDSEECERYGHLKMSGQDLESTYDAFERFVEEVALALACTRFGDTSSRNQIATFSKPIPGINLLHSGCRCLECRRTWLERVRPTACKCSSSQ